MRWFLGRGSQDLFAGLALYADGASAVLMRALPDGGSRLENVCWQEADPEADPEKGSLAKLPGLLRACGVRSAPLTVVLPTDSYALFQLEAPEVPGEERLDALRWRIKDMVDFPVDDALIDSFDLPKSRRPGAPSLCYVAAAPASRVEAVQQAVEKGNGRLRAIDVPEMAIRDLVMNSGQSARAQAYLCLQPDRALIEISVDSTIYLTRQIPFQAGLPDQASQSQMEALLLEVQRSLDYFESQYAVGAVDHLYILSSHLDAERAFLGNATPYLTVPVETFPLTALQGVEQFDHDLLRKSLGAMGAALREMPCVA